MFIVMLLVLRNVVVQGREMRPKKTQGLSGSSPRELHAFASANSGNWRHLPIKNLRESINNRHNVRGPVGKTRRRFDRLVDALFFRQSLPVPEKAFRIPLAPGVKWAGESIFDSSPA
jgi:hypothetical protein